MFDFVHSLLVVDELGYPENFPPSQELATHIVPFSDWRGSDYLAAASGPPRQSRKSDLMPMREFKMGFTDIIKGSLPRDRVNFNWHDSSWDADGTYTVDCMVNGMDIPLFLHAPGSNVQARDATITIYRFNEQEVRGRHAAIFRDASKLTRKVTSQLDAVCDVQFYKFENEQGRIREYLQSLR